jgi:hypothetical protein
MNISEKLQEDIKNLVKYDKEDLQKHEEELLEVANKLCGGNSEDLILAMVKKIHYQFLAGVSR